MAGGFSGPRRGGQARAGVRAVGMDNPVAGQVIHIGVYVAEGHGPDQVQIHVVNADLVQRRVPGYAAAVQLQKAEKIPQVQKNIRPQSCGSGPEWSRDTQENPAEAAALPNDNLSWLPETLSRRRGTKTRRSPGGRQFCLLSGQQNFYFVDLSAGDFLDGSSPFLLFCHVCFLYIQFVFISGVAARPRLCKDSGRRAPHILH